MANANTGFKTVGDARDERARFDAAEIAAGLRVANEAARIGGVLRLYPEIGVLNVRGRAKFYAYVGAARTYVDSFDIDVVAHAIELAKVPA